MSEPKIILRKKFLNKKKVTLGDFIKDLKSVINDQYDSLEDITISKIEQIILDFYKKSMYNSKHEE